MIEEYLTFIKSNYVGIADAITIVETQGLFLHKKISIVNILKKKISESVAPKQNESSFL